jgi:hypothetical protein
MFTRLMTKAAADYTSVFDPSMTFTTVSEPDMKAEANGILV